MPDTGKMKRLFHECTTSPLYDNAETMVYPEGDLDGIAEQISLCLDLAEKNLIEAYKIADAAEQRTAYVIGEARRAHKSLEGALKGSNPNQCNDPVDLEEDDDEDDFAPSPSKGKRRGKKRY